MNRAEKQAEIDDLHGEFGRSPHAVVVDFRGLSVPARGIPGTRIHG